MKRKLFMLAGIIVPLGFYSCQKNAKEVASAVTAHVSTQSFDAQNAPVIFDPGNLVSPAAHGKLDTIGKGFSFTEGPAVNKEGNIYFTDQPNDKIYRWTFKNGAITNFLTGTGRSNGMEFDKDGYLITCADMHGEVWRIAPNGTHTVIAKNFNNKLLNGPNDVWINPVTGGMYFSDPIFPRGYWDANDPRQQAWEPTHSEQAPKGKGGYVYYLAPGSHTLKRVVTSDMGWDSDCWPNGVVGTPDGKKLYVNKWYYDNMGGTWVFDIKPDGTLTNMKKFVDMGGDGMSMDEHGNIYISNGFGITAFDPNGNKVLNIPLANGATNNVFGGKENKTLFITDGSGNLTSIKMNVKGVERF